MNNVHRDNINETINNAIAAYKRGDHFNARKWSMKAVLNNPGIATGWILLAAVSPPDQAIRFLTKAISIDPGNIQARKGLHWAVQKNRSNPQVIEKDELKNSLSEAAGNAEIIRFFVAKFDYAEGTQQHFYSFGYCSDYIIDFTSGRFGQGSYPN